MIYTRTDHIQFLEEELKAVTDEFKKIRNKGRYTFTRKGRNVYRSIYCFWKER